MCWQKWLPGLCASIKLLCCHGNVIYLLFDMLLVTFDLVRVKLYVAILWVGQTSSPVMVIRSAVLSKEDCFTLLHYTRRVTLDVDGETRSVAVCWTWVRGIILWQIMVRAKIEMFINCWCQYFNSSLSFFVHNTDFTFTLLLKVLFTFLTSASLSDQWAKHCLQPDDSLVTVGMADGLLSMQRRKDDKQLTAEFEEKKRRKHTMKRRFKFDTHMYAYKASKVSWKYRK